MSRRWLAPEVVQTSAMDCGPAALKCLLEGFGINASYGRLREACQTDVDGTSIDTLEDILQQIGLDAQQLMVPRDFLLEPSARMLPAIVVVWLPDGRLHFVVAWRRHGPFVQIMDPASGRKLIRCSEFEQEVYQHRFTMAAAIWRRVAGSEDFLEPLRQRLARCGISEAPRWVAEADEDPGWRSLAALDAAARMVSALVRARGVKRGEEASRLLERLYAAQRTPGTPELEQVPDSFWSVRSAPSQGDEERVLVTGAVLVRVRGLLPAQSVSLEQEARRPLSPELVRALEEPPARPGLELLRLLRADGLLAPSVVGVGLVAAAVGTLVEALLLRNLFELGRFLGLWHQRLGAVAALVAFLAFLALIELPLSRLVTGIGHRLEARLRMAFLTSIPQLGDRYLRSRPISDMAGRNHSIYRVRTLAPLAQRLIRASLELVITTIGLAWLAPWSTPVVIAAAAVSLGLPLLLQSRLSERDLRVREHDGALSRFYLDALLGLMAIRAHGAERAVRREHEGLLVSWVRAGRSLSRIAVVAEGLQAVAGSAIAIWLLSSYLERGEALGGLLLLVYWALNLPMLGQEVALAMRQYPLLRNLTLRMLEPLGAPREGGAREGELPTQPKTGGVSVRMEGVSVLAGGHSVLRDVQLAINAGEHLAVVGPSGAGKSSLVGLLLGWLRPSEGQLLVDGEPLSAQRLGELRRETAWVDPAIQLWNRSFLDNLTYGAPGSETVPLPEVLEAAELRRLLETLPDGLQTVLGEGGALVSGGEGQRVRLGRALLRRDARLVILDEPFRGLAREQRRALLQRARRWWPQATLLCVIHDLEETRDFPRVLVVEEGRIVEDGPPAQLEASGGRYSSLLRAEQETRQRVWSSGVWRRVHIQLGRLVERLSGAA
jgi:ATP-binding cassette subfamily B protein